MTKPDSEASPPVPLGAFRHDINELVRDLKTVIHERDGRLTVAETIGAIECVKLGLWLELQP